MATYQGIVLTKSPYYIFESGSAGYTSQIELRIWNGDRTAIPTTEDYLLEKQALDSGSTGALFEISQISNATLSHLHGVYTQNSSSNTDAKWLNVKSFNGLVNRDDTYLILDGYNDFLSGANYHPIPDVMISQEVLYHYDNIPIQFPVYCSGSTGVSTVEFQKNGNTVYAESLVNYVDSNFSYDKVKYITYGASVPGEIDKVVFKNAVNTIINSLSVEPVDCTRYTPYIISFINAFGVNQKIVFDLASREKLNVEKKSFSKNTLNWTGGNISYDTTAHQTQEYNTRGTRSITLSTGFVDESVNATIEELLLSEYVWVTVDDVTSPVNVQTRDIDFKKGVNEGLINYTISFTYSYNTRNTIY